MYEVAARLRELLAAYLSGEMTLGDFAGAFVSETWDLDEVADSETARFGYEIELRLAEQSGGHWTEAELREIFANLLASQVIPSAVARFTLYTSSVLRLEPLRLMAQYLAPATFQQSLGLEVAPGLRELGPLRLSPAGIGPEAGRV